MVKSPWSRRFGSCLSSALGALVVMVLHATAQAQAFHFVIGKNGTVPSVFIRSLQAGVCFEPVPLPSRPFTDPLTPSGVEFLFTGSTADDVIVVVNSTSARWCGRTIQPMALASNQALRIDALDGNDIIWGGDRAYVGPKGVDFFFGALAREVILGGGGHDTIYGGTAVVVSGGTGDDQIIGRTSLGYYVGDQGTSLICGQVDGVFTTNPAPFFVEAAGGSAVYYGPTPLGGLPSSVTQVVDAFTRDRCALVYLGAAFAREDVLD